MKKKIRNTKAIYIMADVSAELSAKGAGILQVSVPLALTAFAKAAKLPFTVPSVNTIVTRCATGYQQS